ncbi:MAG: calcium-binding protein [Actinomycetota bacterium]
MAILVGWTVAGVASTASIAQGAVFQPQDKSPQENPCDKDKVPDDIYASFKTLLAQVLGDKAGVVADIDKQVRDKVPDDKEKPVTVEIHVVTEDEFKREYAGDVDGLPGNEKKSQAELEKEAEELFNGLGAYTYTTDKVSSNGTQVIKVKIFCKESFRTMVIDESPMRELIVHELVHAKLYAIGLLGGTEPFPDHDDDPGNDDEEPFHKEVKRLVELMEKNLEIAYAPNDRFSAPVVATAVRCDTGQELSFGGDGEVALGALGDADGDGHKEVPAEVTALALTSSDGSVAIEEDPQAISAGMIEERTQGQPFPADAVLDLVYRTSSQGAAGQGQSRLQATVNRVPPLAQSFQNPNPNCPQQRADTGDVGPVVIRLLQFVPIDHDGDGLDDHIDPDDDNDGLPDVEDPRPLVREGACTNAGTSKSERIRGSDEADTLCGEGGDDSLFGEAGWDELDGGKGRDRSQGGPGDDRLVGGQGTDRLSDRSGEDVLLGGSGEDVLVAKDRDPGDRLIGGPAQDVCSADRGDIVRSC